MALVIWEKFIHQSNHWVVIFRVLNRTIEWWLLELSIEPLSGDFSSSHCATFIIIIFQLQRSQGFPIQHWVLRSFQGCHTRTNPCIGMVYIIIIFIMYTHRKSHPVAKNIKKILSWICFNVFIRMSILWFHFESWKASMSTYKMNVYLKSKQWYLGTRHCIFTFCHLVPRTYISSNFNHSYKWIEIHLITFLYIFKLGAKILFNNEIIYIYEKSTMFPFFTPIFIL